MIVYNVCARYKPNFTVLAQPLVLISFELCRENSRISKTYTHIIASTTTLEWKSLWYRPVLSLINKRTVQSKIKNCFLTISFSLLDGLQLYYHHFWRYDALQRDVQSKLRYYTEYVLVRKNPLNNEIFK